MAPFRRSFGRPGSMRPRRNYEWCSQDPISLNTRTTTGTTEAIICTADALDKFSKPTLTRITGGINLVMVTSDAPSSQGTNDQITGDLAIYIEDGSATTPPALEVAEGLERSLLWHRHFRLTTQRMNQVNADLTTSAARFYEGFYSAAYIEVDARAKRRMERFQHILLLVSISSKDASDMGGSARFRCLFRE